MIIPPFHTNRPTPLISRFPDDPTGTSYAKAYTDEMPYRRLFWLLICWVAASTSGLVRLPVVSAGENDETIHTATYLMKQSLHVDRQGRYHLLLMSLRQLRDPQLLSLFQSLMDSQQPAIMIHGFLGAAECHPNHQLDLTHLASIKDERLQAEMISAAIDNDLLTLEQAQQAVSWPDLDPTARLLIATRLIQANLTVDRAWIAQTAQGNNLAQRSLAGLLLTQLNDGQGQTILDELKQSPDPKHEQIIEMLLATAQRFDFQRAGPWALSLVQRPELGTRTTITALQTALRLRADQAPQAWAEQYKAAADPAQKMRVGLVALSVSPWVPQEMFDPLMSETDGMLKQIGMTGRAIASQADIPGAMTALVELKHPMISDWVLRYARRHASTQDIPLILLPIVKNIAGPARNQAQRIDDAMSAIQIMLERNAEQSLPVLEPLLQPEGASPEIQETILLGLLRNRTADLQPLLARLPDFKSANCQSLAVLLHAKNRSSLTPEQLQQLSLIIRGGARLPDPLRIQAGWIYLKHTQNSQTVLAELLGG